MILQRSRSLSHVLATIQKQPSATTFMAFGFLPLLIAILTLVPKVSLGQEEKQSSEAKSSSEEKAVAEVKPAAEVKPTIAIINGTLHPVIGPPIKQGKILIANDAILAIGGSELAVPDGVESIDASGLVLTPGWIDVGSRLWLNPAINEEGVNDGSLKAVDGLDPFAEDWKDVIATGVTTVYVQPGAQNSIGGLGAAVAVVPESSGKLTIHNSSAGLQMSLGRFASNRDRSARYEALKNALQGIADYKKKWEEYEAAVKKAAADAASGATPPAEEKREGREGREGRGMPGRSRPDGQPRTPSSESSPNGPTVTPQGSSPQATTPTPQTPASAPAKPKKPDIDPLKQRLLGVLNGEIPIRLEIHNANDAHFALELRKQFPNANWILEDVDQLGNALNAVRESRLPMVIGPWLNFSQMNSSYAKRNSLYKELLQGSDSLVGVATNGVAANGSQYLREHLAVACSHGLARERALQTVTLDAAKLLGCDKKLGALAAGYRADIVGFAGDPLDTSAPVRLVVSGGKVVSKPTESSITKELAVHQHASLPQELPSKFQLHSTKVLLPEGYRDVTLTFDNGSIVAVDQGVKRSDDVFFVEMGESIVTPGLQSVYGTLGIDNRMRGVDSNSAHLSPSDLTTLDLATRKLIEQSGLHVIALATGSANTLPGQIAVYSLSSAGEAKAAAVGSQIVLSADARSMERFPSSLAGQAKFVRDALTLKIEPTRLFVPEQTIEHIAKLKKEVMSQLLGQSQLALFRVTNDAEVEVALQIIEQFKLKACLIGSRSLSRYAERLKGLNVSIIALPVQEGDYPRYMSDLAICHRQGVSLFFAGEHGSQLRLSAARAVQAGVAEDWAIQAITNGIASLYGTEANSVAIEAGRKANVIVWSGNPLDLTSQPVLQICDGKVISDKDKP